MVDVEILDSVTESKIVLQEISKMDEKQRIFLVAPLLQLQSTGTTLFLFLLVHILGICCLKGKFGQLFVLL